ncbi:MAG: hypothetical protein ACLQPD_24135 [Desulfomonilaceae bacterium]
MKANRIDSVTRIKLRIQSLEAKIDASWRHHSKKYGNPYRYCEVCEIHEPELSIRGRHYEPCRVQSWIDYVNYYKNLLKVA